MSLDIDHDEAEGNDVKLTDLFESTKLNDEIPDNKDTTTDLLKESLTEEPNVMEIEEVFKDPDFFFVAKPQGPFQQIASVRKFSE